MQMVSSDNAIMLIGLNETMEKECCDWAIRHLWGLSFWLLHKQKKNKQRKRHV